ncbi:alpha/beta fold hydrolase [Altibacter sp. HG106]|uniref:alpha/beta fold hydrolase n=1 Tax=Altibacter sp. HG106 TaxID=3023937 RepID=UPI0023500B24|nr:alpha/beta hydrolase [Altibacter sp. HG106]MDC7995158.1 alpha/beta hydrolase [Altibacter sp. HG106]
MKTDFQGTSIFYDHDKRGTSTLVLLHGFLEDRTIWDALRADYSGPLSLLSIDLPGHGESGSLGTLHTMEEMAEVVLHVMKQSETTSAHLLGHSMGGYVCLAFAEQFPEHCKSLLLLNSSCEADTSERLINRKRALQVINTNKNSFVSMAIANLFSSSARREFASEIKTLVAKAQKMEVSAIQATIKGMMVRRDRTRVLKEWKRPKEIICGNEDPIIPFSSSRRMATLTKASLTILDGSHMSWLERHDEILKKIHFIE